MITKYATGDNLMMVTPSGEVKRARVESSRPHLTIRYNKVTLDNPKLLQLMPHVVTFAIATYKKIDYDAYKLVVVDEEGILVAILPFLPLTSEAVYRAFKLIEDANEGGWEKYTLLYTNKFKFI